MQKKNDSRSSTLDNRCYVTNEKSKQQKKNDERKIQKDAAYRMTTESCIFDSYFNKSVTSSREPSFLAGVTPRR